MHNNMFNELIVLYCIVLYLLNFKFTQKKKTIKFCVLARIHWLIRDLNIYIYIYTPCKCIQRYGQINRYPTNNFIQFACRLPNLTSPSTKSKSYNLFVVYIS